MRRLALGMVLAAGCLDYNLEPDPDPNGLVDTDATDTNTEPIDDDGLPDGTVTGGLRGSICQTADQGLQGVTVMLEHPFGVAQTVTDVNGDYELLNLPAGDFVLIATGAEYFAQIPVHIPPNEVVEVASEECSGDCDIPIPCIGLAEALDRGGAAIRLADGIVVTNTSEDLSICLDEWMVMLSEGSQDALLGQEPMVRIEPGQTHVYPYGVDVYGGYGDEAWWCIERYQYTKSGSSYLYNGSLGPSGLMDYVIERTDANLNGFEDHHDYNVDDGQLQTQHNIWTTESKQPILIVGRARSLVELAGSGARPEVTVQVRNLGQQPGSGTITERIPAGFVVADVQPEADVATLGDGSTLLTWVVSLDGARPDTTLMSPTSYDQVDLSYHLSLGAGACEGRCVGEGVEATWTDLNGKAWISHSEPLILEHCPPG